MSLELRRRMMATDVVPSDAIIIAKRSDNETAIMEVVSAKGWSKSPKYMTKREAEAVKTIGDAFKGNTLITDLSILKYFTNQVFTTISQSAFQGCTSLGTIQFPEQVTKIGGISNAAGTFYNCTSLSKVVLPPNLSLLQGRAFFGCSSLKSVQLPESITNLHQAFWGSYIEEITIPESITTLANATFWDCTKLKKINLTNATTKDDTNSFRNSSLSKNIYYKGTIKEWYKSLFNASYGLLTYGFTLYINGNPLPKTITIDEDMSCNNAFSRQKTIEKVEIQGNATSLSVGCFDGATNLKEVVISTELSNIPSQAFKGCTSLKTINLPSSIKYMSSSNSYSAFADCSALESEINLPNVISIGYSAFEKCTKIPSIVIGDSCTTIDNNAFSNCKSAKIEIGTGVMSIGGLAFTNVSSVIIKAQNPPTIAENTFTNYHNNIYVPQDSLNLYKSAEYWSALASRIKPISELPQ
jgi:hypothetical protein